MKQCESEGDDIMSINVQYLATPQYLQATLSGEWTEAGIRDALDGIRAEADARKIKMLLLDLDELSRPDYEMTRFFSGQYLAQVLGPPFVVSAYSKPELINRFAETVAVNRSACFAIFPERDSAIAWLTDRMFPELARNEDTD
jgi:hypothetical protein